MSIPLRLAVLLGAGLVFLAGLALVFWLWSGGSTQAVRQGEPPPPDPRLTYRGPFKNIDPSVGYVGDKACALCHPDVARIYKHHPMKQTLAPYRPAPDRPLDQAHHHPFAAIGLHFEVLKKDGRWYHRASRTDEAGQPLASLDLTADYSIGSGTHGLSYLSVRDGFVTQTGVSWYSQKKIWDLSPGFTEQTVPGRVVGAICLYCHSNRAEALPGQANRFREPVFPLGHGVGCERCHGPGELHIDDSPDSADKDTTIVHPGKLPWRLRENVCEQCHLQGELRVVRRGRSPLDWRPGLPLEEFFAIFIPADSAADSGKANGHVEQMYQSRCFQKGPDDRKMGCISCHNPHEHVTPERRVAHYRQRCLNCHQKRGCSLDLAERQRRAPGDSCIDCHMPRHAAADIVHTALTDHRILRRPTPPHGKLRREATGLVNFYRDRLRPGDPEARRDLGIALAQHMRDMDPRLRREAPRAIGALNEALRRAPDDLDAREALGDARFVTNQFNEAEQEYASVLAVMPTRERSLLGALEASQKAGLNRTARQYAEQLVQLSPYRPRYREEYVWLLLGLGETEEALVQTRAWVKLAPFSMAARTQLFRLLLGTGRTDEALGELKRLRRLRPSNLAELEALYAGKAKGP